MNNNFIFDIVELALGIAKRQSTGQIEQETALVESLLQIIQKSVQAYQAHTGQPLDPSLIQPEMPVR